ncbi:hypothetical protein [Pseudonocardia sp.]|jgi:hypothetical protein|uniref:hypothetical protein n=1 Tax=Pseudonocardia sp. TaxID=60912 RepID=UPI003D145EF8
MFVSHHLDTEMFVHRDRLLADADEFRLARLARAARRRRRRESAAPPSARNLAAPAAGRDDSGVAAGPVPDAAAPAPDGSTGGGTGNRDVKRRSRVRA